MKRLFLFLLWLAVESGVWGQAPRLVVPVGHTDAVTSVAFSPDGKYVLTGSRDNTAKLWDLEGREIQTFRGHTKEVNSVKFSPDGKQILTGSSDKTVKLWNLNGKEVYTINGHSGSIESLGFSPDGKYFMTGSSDKTARIWDLSGNLIQTLEGHTSGVTSVDISPDSKYFLTGSWDKTAKVWDLSGHLIQTLKGHNAGISSVAFSPDNQYILTGSWDQTAKLWNFNGIVVKTFVDYLQTIFIVRDSPIKSVSFSPDGKKVLISSIDNSVKLWELDGRIIDSFRGHLSYINSSTFSPDGKFVFTGSEDQTARLWDFNKRTFLTFGGKASGIFPAVFSPDNKKIFSGSRNNRARLWDINHRTIQLFSGHKYGITSVAFSPDGKHVLTGSEDATAKIWELNGREINTFRGHESYYSYEWFESRHPSTVNCVAFSPNSLLLVTGSGDKMAKLWKLNGEELRTFKCQDTNHEIFLLKLDSTEIQRFFSGHTLPINSIAFSPDGQYILTGSKDATAKLWDLNGKELHTFKGHLSQINSVAFSPNGQQVLTGSSDATSKLWNITGKEVYTYNNHTSAVNSVAFSPNGQQILISSEDGTAKLWDCNGGELQTFIGHSSSIRSAIFSSDGRQILTSSFDYSAKLWDTQTGQCLATLIALDSTDWVVTTPSGLFDASPGAMKLMYYVQGLEVIELDQLKERYYEPGLLAKIMGFDKSELRNVANFDQVDLYPEINATIANDRLNITLTERSGSLGKLSLFINGKEVQEDLNPKRLKSLSIDLDAYGKYYSADADNTLALRAYNADGWLKSQAYELTYRPVTSRGTAQPNTDVPVPKSARPSLYALVVGTSNYAGERLDLRFADLDAEAIAKALQNAGSALFNPERTHIHLLSTAAAESSSKSNIQKAFGDLATQTKPEDVLVVYFSGHGLAYGPAEKEQFYYLTKDIGSENLSDPTVRDNYTISSNELTKWLTAIPAQKQVMILDACNAGKAVESLATVVQKELNPSQIRALDRMKDRTGMFILTGSAADKVSYEASQYGQGLLTYSLLQGMSGLALTEDKRVDVMTLFQYSRDHVPELAKGIGGIQTPVLAFPAGGSSFDIGIVTPQVKIPVAQVKPVFIRNNFQNEDTFDDNLRLTDALENYFREITAKGAEAEIIFVDVKEYENAYSIKGRYRVDGEAVIVRGRLFRGAEAKGEIQVAGKKSAMRQLAEEIVEKVASIIKRQD